jgi:ABC-type polysaccharide/polyol phosphate transport system ATPase subunit
MNKDLALKAEGLLKDYHIYDSPAERFKELFFKEKRHRVFRALGPLDLEIPKGETFGIVGENGAGKSTFLKLVTGVIEPSSGTVTLDGRVSSILELGTGFNPEFTGRENVLLNGALHGFSSGEINKRMDMIENFAAIGEFIDMPVKTYSSGMNVRLAFSLAVHVDADILVIDEALAVGDGLFMKKCIDKIWEQKNRGATLLFCSHSLYTVANFCERTVWLNKGSIGAVGGTKEVLSIYEDYLREKEGAQKAGQTPLIPGPEKKVAKINRIDILSGGQKLEKALLHSEDLEVHIDFEVFENKDVYVGFAVDRNDGLCCYADNMMKQGTGPFHGPCKGSVKILLKNCPLLSGEYKFVIFLLDETALCIFDKEESPFFRITTKEKEWGVCHIQHEWRT